MAKEIPVELHFTDTFSGEEITVLLNGEEVQTFQAKTKFQIGLAEVIHLKSKTGDVIDIMLPQLDINERIILADPPRYIIIRLVDRKLMIEQTSQQQRYL